MTDRVECLNCCWPEPGEHCTGDRHVYRVLSDAVPPDGQPVSMSRVGTILAAVWRWFSDDGHQWRSWLGHTLLVLALAVVFGVRPAILVYAFRELEQAVVKQVEGKPQNVRDNLLDIVVPMLALAVVSLAFGLR